MRFTLLPLAAASLLATLALARPRAKPPQRGDEHAEEVQDTVRPQPFATEDSPTATDQASTLEIVGEVLAYIYHDLDADMADLTIAQTSTGHLHLVPHDGKIAVSVTSGKTLLREFTDDSLEYFLDPSFEDTAEGVVFHVGARQKFGYDKPGGDFATMASGKGRISVTVDEDDTKVLKVKSYGNVKMHDGQIGDVTPDEEEEDDA